MTVVLTIRTFLTVINKLDKNYTYTIAEIGINHNGDLDIAKKLISISAAAGFDAVKFQKRNPECVPDHMKDKPRSTPWGDMTYLEYKYKVEFDLAAYREIDEWCKLCDIQWSASPWDMDSVEFLHDNFDLPWMKVASALNNNEDIVKACADSCPSVIVSAGMAGMSETTRLIEWVRDVGTDDITLLHCNSSYPAPLEELNLSCIPTLATAFPDCTIGYSGHEYGLTPSIAAVALGARVIERHVTLDKTMWGSDQMCSIEPHGMFKLVRGIRDIEKSLGDGEKVISESERSKMESLR